KVVHPIKVGRKEDIGRCPLLDLLGERRGGRVTDHDLVAGLGFIKLRRVVERIFEACCRKHGDVCCSRRGRDERQGDKAEGKREHKAAPDGIWGHERAPLNRRPNVWHGTRKLGKAGSLRVRSSALDFVRHRTGTQHRNALSEVDLPVEAEIRAPLKPLRPGRSTFKLLPNTKRGGLTSLMGGIGMATAHTAMAGDHAGLLDKERIIAPAGYNRWLVPPAALAIHL